MQFCEANAVKLKDDLDAKSIIVETLKVHWYGVVALMHVLYKSSYIII